MKKFCFDFDSSACESCGGKCCTGESGYIFVSLNEMENIAKFLNISFEDFLLRYIKKVGYRFSLIEKALKNEYACVFFDSMSKRCLIYEVRPKQCRDFPFWEVYLEKENLPQLLKECKGVKKKNEID